MSGKRYPMTPDTARAVFEREQGSCAVCGLAINGIGHLHHRLPRGMGGGRYANTISNLLHLHHSCHLYKVEKEREKALLMGWLVRRGMDPSEVPVRYKMRDLVLLSDDGSMTIIEER